MMCKYCNKIELEWPENWTKGMSPIEVDTHINHTRKRCEEMKNSNVIRSKPRVGIMRCGVTNCGQCRGLPDTCEKLGDLMRA